MRQPEREERDVKHIHTGAHATSHKHTTKPDTYAHKTIKLRAQSKIFAFDLFNLGL